MKLKPEIKLFIANMLDLNYIPCIFLNLMTFEVGPKRIDNKFTIMSINVAIFRDFKVATLLKI